MCFREEKEDNLSLLRWEGGMANMVLINIKPSPCCPAVPKHKN